MQAGAAKSIGTIFRIGNAFRIFAATSTMLLAALFAIHPVHSQGLPPQKDYYVGEGQVELLRGTFLYNNTDIVSGSGNAAVPFVRQYGVSDRGSGPFGAATTHNLHTAIYVSKFREEPNGPGKFSNRFYVVIGGSRVETFYRGYGDPGITYEGGSGGYQSLSYSIWTGPFTYTGPDGEVISFGTTSIGGCFSSGLASGGWCAVADSMTYADGTRWDFQYDPLAGVSSKYYLRLMKSNRGFGIGLNYATTAAGKTITQACAINLSQNYASLATPCPAGVQSVQYGYACGSACGLTSYTDVAGQVTTYGIQTLGISSITSPGSSSPDLTIGYHSGSGKVQSQTFANGAAWLYSYSYNSDPWDVTPFNYQTDVTSPAGTSVRHEFYAEKPSFVQDELGRRVGYTYVWAGGARHVERKTDPEGNETRYNYGMSPPITYSGIRQPIEVRKVAKPGSGQADIVTTATYPSLTSCANPKTCEKPVTTTDANGNITSYTYDATHGGVLTETGPALNGVQPQKRHEYAQRYSWVKNSTGTYVQSATPVWVKARERHCRTTAASGSGCAGGAVDEVVTDYDYGPNSGPNTLLLRGVVVTAANAAGTLESLRTCYTYDVHGNRISETKPLANLTSCP